MSWGIRIAVLLTVFVTGMVTLVLISFSKNIELVTDNYYEKDKLYQERIDSEKRSRQLENDLQISHDENYITFVFPQDMEREKISGVINFYRPSEATLDADFEITPSEANSQKFNLAAFKNGFWKVNINWSYDGVSYFKSDTLTIE